MAQSINDYLKSYGVDPNERYSNTTKNTTTTTKKTSNSSGGSSSNKYYTTVTESNGSKSEGYIQDGVSYYNNGKPINAGASVVDSTGKTWVKGGDPDAGLTIDEYKAKYGVSGGSNNSYKPNYGDMGDELSYNPYEDQYNQLKEAYERQEALLREQNRLAVEQGTNRLNAQKSNINQAADENARQAYVQYMQSQKALPQQLASQGVSGGATETANLGLQTAYQNNVNAINQNKANRLQEIDNAIVDLQNTGDLSTVEQVLANNQAALDAYMNTFDKGVGYNQWANQFNANRQDTLADQAYRDKVYADTMTQQQLENEWYERNYSDSKKQNETNTVISLLENGLVDVNYASTLLGVPVDQLNNFVNYINKARNLELNNTQSLISNRNSGGSGGNGGYKTANKVDVFNDALAMLKTDGWTADDVMKFVWGQGLSEADEMEVLSNLGLLNNNTPVETQNANQSNVIAYNAPTTLSSMLNAVNLPVATISSDSTTDLPSKSIWEQSKEKNEPAIKTFLNNLKKSN